MVLHQTNTYRSMLNANDMQINISLFHAPNLQQSLFLETRFNKTQLRFVICFLSIWHCIQNTINNLKKFPNKKSQSHRLTCLAPSADKKAEKKCILNFIEKVNFFFGFKYCSIVFIEKRKTRNSNYKIEYRIHYYFMIVHQTMI